MKLPAFNLFMFGDIALILAITLLGVIARRHPTRRYSTPQGQLGFRKPMILRIAMVMLGLVFVSGPEMLIGQPHKALSADTWAAFVLIVVVCFVFAGICLRASGPEDLLLNLETHTYRFVTGWPFFPRTNFGDWEDMHELCVWDAGGSSTIHVVAIAWKSQQGTTRLGRFSRKSSADRFADEMSKLLCLKRVNSRPS